MGSFCSEKNVVLNQKDLKKTHRIQQQRQKIWKQSLTQFFFLQTFVRRYETFFVFQAWQLSTRFVKGGSVGLLADSWPRGVQHKIQKPGSKNLESGSPLIFFFFQNKKKFLTGFWQHKRQQNLEFGSPLFFFLLQNKKKSFVKSSISVFSTREVTDFFFF
jgi:hypothetical protein